jgi:hypothetical protein
VAGSSATIDASGPPGFTISRSSTTSGDGHASAVLSEISHDWETERAYLNMEAR